MRHLLYVALAVVLAIVAAVILGTSGTLPPIVASHFALGGRPNGWMSHDFYVIFILGVGIAVPLFIALAMSWLPRIAPRLVNAPNKDYWLAEPRREASLGALSTFGCLIGMLVGMFVLAIHLLTVNANAQVPPRLDESLLVALLVVFVVSLVAIIIGVFVRFRAGTGRGMQG